ncbi:MAG: hypothetical protein HY719_09785 [Planctomycetes bacterium]|nr:hypothetical protein [Planctomycetota bacterium]
MATLSSRYGGTKRVGTSHSLFEVGTSGVTIYVRYSKKHPDNRTFFGLRQDDLAYLESRPSVMCFLWDGQQTPLLVPFEEYAHVFRAVKPASDNQFKAQVYEGSRNTELYIANAGRFNVDGHWGWEAVDQLAGNSTDPPLDLTHSQVQSMLASIGSRKGLDVWIPLRDRFSVEAENQDGIEFRKTLPDSLVPALDAAEQIDVVWFDRGGPYPSYFYEVEHSTPIYSGLLRFNDVLLAMPNLAAGFGVVSRDERRDTFVRQLSRPTFRASGLAERCTFFDYENVYRWHSRLFSVERQHAEA